LDCDLDGAGAAILLKSSTFVAILLPWHERDEPAASGILLDVSRCPADVVGQAVHLDHPDKRVALQRQPGW
jgi:hypothetical protein